MLNLKPCLFIWRIGKLQHIAVAFSAPLALNSAALPLVCCNSFDVPGGYLVELTIGICTLGRTSSSRVSEHFVSDPACPRLVQCDVVIATS